MLPAHFLSVIGSLIPFGWHSSLVSYAPKDSNKPDSKSCISCSLIDMSACSHEFVRYPVADVTGVNLGLCESDLGLNLPSPLCPSKGFNPEYQIVVSKVRTVKFLLCFFLLLVSVYLVLLLKFFTNCLSFFVKF